MLYAPHFLVGIRSFIQARAFRSRLLPGQGQRPYNVVIYLMRWDGKYSMSIDLVGHPLLLLNACMDEGVI